MMRISGQSSQATCTVLSLELPSTRMISSTHSGICGRTKGRFFASFIAGMTTLTRGRGLTIGSIERNFGSVAASLGFDPGDEIIDSNIVTTPINSAEEFLSVKNGAT